MKFVKMLKKVHRMQFFENFECFDNLLIINSLYLNIPFPPSDVLKNSLDFEFLFRRTSKAEIYILFNISIEAHCAFFRFPVFFYFQRAVLNFSAHSERISSVLQIKLQCAENLKI